MEINATNNCLSTTILCPTAVGAGLMMGGPINGQLMALPHSSRLSMIREQQRAGRGGVYLLGGVNGCNCGEKAADLCIQNILHNAQHVIRSPPMSTTKTIAVKDLKLDLRNFRTTPQKNEAERTSEAFQRR